MKDSISKLSPEYNTHRMVQEYVSRFYMLAAKNCTGLREGGYKESKDFTAWKKKMLDNWRDLSIAEVTADTSTDFVVGQQLQVTAKLKLGALSPQDLAVEVYYGPLDAGRNIIGSSTAEMIPGEENAGVTTYNGKVPCNHSGQHGYTIRVLPRHEHLVNPYELGLILWN